MSEGTATEQTGCLTSPTEKTRDGGGERERVCVCPLANSIPDQPEGRNRTEPFVMLMCTQVLFLIMRVLVKALPCVG